MNYIFISEAFSGNYGRIDYASEVKIYYSGFISASNDDNFEDL